MTKITDIKKFIVGLETPMIEAISGLNKRVDGHQFLLVTDNEEKLAGTLTDGDIRRALLSGFQMSDPVRVFMNSNPRSMVNSRKESDMLAELNNRVSQITFLPILKSDATVDYVLLNRLYDAPDNFALIMAGGFGTRLGSQTSNKPKALVEVGGIPLMEHVLRQIENIAPKHIFISVHYLADMVEDYINQTGRHEKVSILKETEPMGTAGAISMLPQMNEGNLIVANCDLISNLDINDLARFHSDSNSEATIAAATHKFQIPYGVLRHNSLGLFEKIEEKPVFSNYVAAGIYIFSASFIQANRLAGYQDMPDYIHHGQSNGMTISIFPLHEEWTDVGRPEELERANFDFARKRKLK